MAGASGNGLIPSESDLAKDASKPLTARVVRTGSVIAISAAVIAVGVLGIVGSFGSLLLGGASFLAGAVAWEWLQGFGGGMLFGGILQIIAGVAQIIGGIGMLFVEKWAWWLAFIATAVVFLEQLLGIGSAPGVLAIVRVVGLIVPGLLLIGLVLTRKPFWRA
jgi:hypothetical protein